VDVLELGRRVIDEINRGNIDAVVARCHPEIEFVPYLASVEGGGAYRGHEGMRRWWSEREAVWGQISMDAVEGEPLPGGLLMRGTLTARGRGSGVEMEMPFAAAARLEDGLVTWWGFYRTDEEALAAFSAAA
jgi:hypothetical protein